VSAKIADKALEYFLVKASTLLETDNSVGIDSGYHHNGHRWDGGKVVDKRHARAQALWNEEMWQDEMYLLPFLYRRVA
jgi:hypothetical protein